MRQSGWRVEKFSLKGNVVGNDPIQGIGIEKFSLGSEVSSIDNENSIKNMQSIYCNTCR